MAAALAVHIGRSARGSHLTVSAIGIEGPDYGSETRAVGEEGLLVAQAVRGEHGAFGQLYQRHLDEVYRYVYFRVRDAALAEDLTQDIFLNALGHIQDLRHHDRFRSWLLRIAEHRVISHWRHAAARPRLADTTPEELIDAQLLRTGNHQDGAADAFGAVEARLDAGAVLAAAAQLTALQQQVIALRFVAGLSLSETADAMDRSVDAVKNLQFHAAAALRRRCGAKEEEP